MKVIGIIISIKTVLRLHVCTYTWTYIHTQLWVKLCPSPPKIMLESLVPHNNILLGTGSIQGWKVKMRSLGWGLISIWFTSSKTWEVATQEEDDRKRRGGSSHPHPKANEKGSFPGRCRRNHCWRQHGFRLLAPRIGPCGICNHGLKKHIFSLHKGHQMKERLGWLPFGLLVHVLKSIFFYVIAT